MSDHRRTILGDFHAAVDMTPKQMGGWLKTEHSRQVGRASRSAIRPAGASWRSSTRSRPTCPRMDYAHMRKVVAYVHRRMAQCPGGDMTETRWRYALMNWGHDPTK